ncbi:hypothetical protein, partial [Cognatishimia sp. F0-27]|uniref:hypothetical protein n=1 Tax=Cognatishimia sp. F0-27 TaxID=2816855 RepID=UPI001DE432E3|nr:hypothetical protein [Cognatishimia sp. F0-27]
MTRIFTTALVALSTTAGVALAQDADMITDAERTQIEAYAPNADVTMLSDQQIDSLIAVLNSGRSESEKRAYAQS